MDDNGGERVLLGDKTTEIDWLSNLPESLLNQVLLNLPTKNVVKCSVLSSKWRNLWKLVPGLDLDYRDFPEYNAFVSFVDRLLGFNSESFIQNFKLKLDWNENEDEPPDTDNFTRWINIVVERKVEHLHVSDRPWVGYEMQIPLTVYTCGSLVSLKLDSVILPTPKFVSLPCVKVIDLNAVKFVNDLALEMLISGCPVLLRFTCASEFDDLIGRVVAIDASRLEYLELSDYETTFTINNSSSLVKVNIKMRYFKRFEPDDPQKRNMFRNFLVGISGGVNYMHISSDTLEAIYDCSKYSPLPIFRNLSFLDVDFNEYTWKMLLILFDSCPNLKSLVMEITIYTGEAFGSLPGPKCFLSSLEFVKIVERTVWSDATQMKLLSYFLENSKNLKKFTLYLDDFRKKEPSFFLKKLLTIPRLSTSCQVVVL